MGKTKTQVVGVADELEPRHAWLFGDVLVSIWGNEMRWYRAPTWREGGRLSLGECLAIAAPLDAGEHIVLCWRSTGRLTVAGWSRSSGKLDAPITVDDPRIDGNLCQAFGPDGTHGVTSHGSWQAPGLVLLRAPGAAGYEIREATVPSHTVRLYLNGSEVLTCTERTCLTRGNVVLDAHADSYDGSDDEIDTTVFVRASRDFGTTWSELVPISKRTDSSLAIHPLASDGAIVSYGGYGHEPWGLTLAYSKDGAVWERLPHGKAVKPGHALGPLHTVIEAGDRLLVFSHAQYASWRRGKPEAIHDLPVPPGFASPWVRAAHLAGDRVLLLHHETANWQKKTKGALAISELANM